MTELSSIEVHILQSLQDEAQEADDNPGHFPLLDYYKGDPDWEAAQHLEQLGLVSVETETSDHLVLKEHYKGYEALEAHKKAKKGKKDGASFPHNPHVKWRRGYYTYDDFGRKIPKGKRVPSDHWYSTPRYPGYVIGPSMDRERYFLTYNVDAEDEGTPVYAGGIERRGNGLKTADEAKAAANKHAAKQKPRPKPAGVTYKISLTKLTPAALHGRRVPKGTKYDWGVSENKPGGGGLYRAVGTAKTKAEAMKLARAAKAELEKKAKAKAKAKPKAKAKAGKVSSRLRASAEGEPSTFLAFASRDDFEQACALLGRAVHSGSSVAEVDSESLQMRLTGAKGDAGPKGLVKWFRKGPTGRAPNKTRVSFKVHNPHPPRSFSPDRGRRPVATGGTGQLGELLRTGRKARGVRAATLAAAMGITPSTLGGIERGAIKCPPKARLEAAGRLLGIPTATLTYANDCDYGKAKPVARKKKATKKKRSKKASKKATKKVKITLEVVKFAVGDYHWNVLSAAGRKLDTGKSKKKVTALKTVKAKGRKRGLEDGKVKSRDATDKEQSRHGARKKGRKAKVAKDRCARKGPIGSAARKELPSKAFAVPSTRSYPLYKLGSDGKIVPSASHASNAKARAKQALNRGRMTRAQYNSVVRKANKVLSQCSPAVRKARAKAKSSTRAKVKRELSKREQQAILNAAVRELAGV